MPLCRLRSPRWFLQQLQYSRAAATGFSIARCKMRWEFAGDTAIILGAEGKKALLLVWDNAAWHVSKRVRAWIKAHNRKARAEGGVRIVACFLPVKSPWLNPIEPKWAHGKKAVVEPDRLLAAAEVRTRVCDYYGCEQLEPLAQLSA